MINSHMLLLAVVAHASYSPAGRGLATRAVLPAPLALRSPVSAVMAAGLPTSPKELATDASLAVQAALSDGHRRLEVSLPDGLCFFGGAGKQNLGDPDTAMPAGVKDKADRDLAYLVSEMFGNISKPLSPDEIFGKSKSIYLVQNPNIKIAM